MSPNSHPIESSGLSQTGRKYSFPGRHTLLSLAVGTSFAQSLLNVCLMIDGIEDIVVQAASGRVDTLLIAAGASCQGTFDRDEQKVSRSEDAQSDLVNLAVRETLRAGGSVLQLGEEEANKSVAAIFRY